MTIVLDGTNGITDADGSTVLNTNDLASQAQAQAGTDNTTLMTPLRTAQANAGVGAGQTWQTVSRALSTSYQNLTGKPIGVSINFDTNSNAGTRTVQVSADNSTWFTINQFGPNVSNMAFFWIVPSTYYYRFNASNTTLNLWTELR
jgi:hypothetical protein